MEKPNSFLYGNSFINYKIKRTNRKRSIGMSIGKDLIVQVSAPRSVTTSEIEKLLKKKASWIISKREFIKENTKVSDFEHYYLGQRYDIDPLQAPSRILKQWFKQRAEDYILQTSDEVFKLFSPKLSKKPKIDFKNMKSKWGMCSNTGQITFNYELIRTPPECVKYVVIHEFCHLFEMNHGPNFYKLMNHYCPNWKSIRKEISKFSYKID